MTVMTCTKNITQTAEGNGVIIRVNLENEYWIASFEEDLDNNVMLDQPIKVLHCVGEVKSWWKSYKEFNLTKEIVDALDKVISLWDDASDETKKVLL